MKKVIIGIHGLGNKPPQYLLKKWWANAMGEGLKNAKINIDLPAFEFVYWADILYHMPLNFWMKDKTNSYFLDEPYVKTPKNFKNVDNSYRQKLNISIVNILNKVFLKKDKTLKNRFISDFFIQKYFYELEVYYSGKSNKSNDFNSKAKKQIKQRLSKIIHKYKNYDIMLVAHSMGSIIAYDVLRELHRDIKIHTFVTIGSPLGFPIVVSEIAKDSNGGVNITPECITNKWVNHADLLDNVALNYNLSDIYRQNSKGVKPTDRLVINNYTINSHANPHKSFGYLRTPQFSDLIKEFTGFNKPVYSVTMKNKLKDAVSDIRLRGEKIWKSNKSA